MVVFPHVAGSTHLMSLRYGQQGFRPPQLPKLPSQSPTTTQNLPLTHTPSLTQHASPLPHLTSITCSSTHITDVTSSRKPAEPAPPDPTPLSSTIALAGLTVPLQLPVYPLGPPQPRARLVPPILNPQTRIMSSRNGHHEETWLGSTNRWGL